MFSNKVFLFTFLVSIALHTFILIQDSNFSIFSRNKPEQKIEVSYLKESIKQEASLKDLTIKKSPFDKLPPKISIDKQLPVSRPEVKNLEDIFKKNMEQLQHQATALKPISMKPESIAMKKKITLPPIDIDKINNPSYISYYQLVREKIRRAAYQNYIRSETGEVYLSFLILKDGRLKEVKLQEERTSGNSYLKQTGLKSIQDASPFPPFPKELDYTQLSFNVIISFEIE
jgi:TonB family protein